jgi:hypothetical protein
MLTTKVIVLLSLLLGSSATPEQCEDLAHRLVPIIEAIRHEESGGEVDPNIAIGKAGEQGSLQIMRDYHTDASDHARKFNLEVPDYDTVTGHPDHSALVLVLYMHRYQRSALLHADPEIIARTHNGGPRGASKDLTLAYWKRVRSHLQHHDQ